MSRRIVLVLVLAGLLVSLQVRHVHELITRGSGRLFDRRIEHGELVVESLRRGPASGRFVAAGLREGDVIESAYTDGVGGRVTGMGLLLDVRRSANASAPMRLVVRRPSAGDARLTVTVPMPSIPARILALYLAWTILVPSVALVAALLLGLLKAEDTRAFIGSLLFITFAGAFGLEPDLLAGEARTIALVAKVLCTFGLIVLFLWFFLIFPRPSIIERRVTWLKHAALVVMSACAAVTLARRSAELASFETFEALRAWFPDRVVGRVSDVFGVSFIGVGLLSLTLNTVRRQSRDDRRRMIIILAGTLISLLPFVTIAAYLSTSEPQPPPLWLAVVLGALIGVFPLSFVYAVVRHRVLGIRLMLRRGAQYALISAGFRVVLGTVVFLLFWFGVAPVITPVGQGPLTSGLMAAGAAIAAARLLRTVRSRVMPAIDRRFFRDAYDARRVLTDLSRFAREMALEPDRLLTRLVGSVSATLHPRRTAVLMRAIDPITDRGTGPFRCRVLRSDEGSPVDPATIEVPSRGVVATRVAPRDGASVGPVDLFLDEPRSWARALVADRAHAGERASIDALGVQLVVPLVAGPRLLGLLLLGEKRSEEPYSRDDKELLATVAEQTALALDYGQLARRAGREESLRKEVEIARSVQTRLFPQVLPPIPALQYAGACRPAREIGGDSYDFIALGDGSLGLAVGDISGKGVAAALLMANLQALLRSHAPLPGRALKDLVGDINRLLSASIPDNRFATFFYGVFDSPTRSFTYVNAGHNPPMLLRKGAREAMRLEPTGVMLGMFPDAVFEQATVALAPGDLLVVYSDGICDALNLAGQDYGDVRLEAYIKANAHQPAGELIDRILEDVIAFGEGVPPFDDMTLVVAKVRDVDGPAGSAAP